jgi:quinone-modifying oxidoreductase subunit QmoB
MSVRDKKTAVWICRGCDIGKSLDVEALENVATGDCKADVFRSHPFLCGDEGVELIKNDVRQGADALVIAGCSPRFNSDTFTFQGMLTERVNLRELVVWSHPPNDEDTQMLAEDYLRMGIARARMAEVPKPFETEIDKTLLVVGGGQSGITAALDAALTGYDVVLVCDDRSIFHQERVNHYSQQFLLISYGCDNLYHAVCTDVFLLDATLDEFSNLSDRH